MTKSQCKIIVPLFKGFKKNANLKKYVYGSSQIPSYETFASALDRYLAEMQISCTGLETISGISKSTIARYLKVGSFVGYYYLCAICITLRLHPIRQRHLFALLGYRLPSEKLNPEDRDYIIQKYLDSCSFFEDFTLSACNCELKDKTKKPLTKIMN